MWPIQILLRLCAGHGLWLLHEYYRYFLVIHCTLSSLYTQRMISLGIYFIPILSRLRRFKSPVMKLLKWYCCNLAVCTGGYGSACIPSDDSHAINSSQCSHNSFKGSTCPGNSAFYGWMIFTSLCCYLLAFAPGMGAMPWTITSGKIFSHVLILCMPVTSQFVACVTWHRGE